MLRRLVMTAVDAEGGGTPGPVRRRERTTRRFEIRLTDEEIAALDAEADALGMKRTDWVTRLVRCRLHSAAPLPLEEVVARAAARAALVRLCEEGLSNPEAKAQYERARAAHPRDAAGIGPDCLLVNLFSSAP